MRIVVGIVVVSLSAASASAQSGYVTTLKTPVGLAKGLSQVTTSADTATLPTFVPNPAPTTIVRNLPPGANAILQEGTPVYLLTQQEMSSKNNKVGDRIELRVAEHVRVNGVTVIPAGSRGVGEITRVEKKGAFGKSGKLDARVLHVRVGDQNIGLGGTANEAGAGGTVGTVAAAVLFWPVAPFVTGKSAVFPPGTRMTGWVENDVPLSLPSTGAPLVVPATQP